MTQATYEKPDAGVCKVWACPTHIALFAPQGREERWQLYIYESLHSHGMVTNGRCLPRELPPGPWVPCHLPSAEKDAAGGHNYWPGYMQDWMEVNRAERAVLEAAEAIIERGTWPSGSRLHEELREAVRWLQAARAPAKAQRPAMVAVALACGDIAWVTAIDRNGRLGVVNDIDPIDAYEVRRVLPESEHAEPWRDCDRELADAITQAMM